MPSSESEKKICHITTVHQWNDPRIFRKQCRTLNEKGYQVHLIAPGHSRFVDNIKIHGLKDYKGNQLFKRIAMPFKALRVALKIDAKVYHFHDPELIYAGVILKMIGKKVIYDIHEDYVSAIRHREDFLLRSTLAFIFGIFEKICSAFFINILAERYYKERFPQGKLVLNYPLKADFSINDDVPSIQEKTKSLLYTGNITKERGALIHANILQSVEGSLGLTMIGRCAPELYERLKEEAGEYRENLTVVGVDKYVPFDVIKEAYQKSWIAGLIIFPRNIHYMRKENTKFFEYMAAGLPIICSNFPVWKDLMNKTGAGITVDPDNVEEIVAAIKWLKENPEEQNKMRRAGMKAIQHTYNWEVEGQKLLKIYDEII